MQNENTVRIKRFFSVCILYINSHDEQNVSYSAWNTFEAT